MGEYTLNVFYYTLARPKLFDQINITLDSKDTCWMYERLCHLDVFDICNHHVVTFLYPPGRCLGRGEHKVVGWADSLYWTIQDNRNIFKAHTLLKLQKQSRRSTNVGSQNRSSADLIAYQTVRFAN